MPNLDPQALRELLEQVLTLAERYTYRDRARSSEIDAIAAARTALPALLDEMVEDRTALRAAWRIIFESAPNSFAGAWLPDFQKVHVKAIARALAQAQEEGKMAEITVRWDAQTQTFLAKTEHGEFRQYGQGETERQALESLVGALTLTIVVLRDQQVKP